MIKGIIFDMDGVIIDSNSVHYENWSDIFTKKFNKKIDKKYFSEHLGESPVEFTEHMIEYTKVDSRYDEIYPIVRDNYIRLKSKIKLKEGIKEALPKLKKKYKIALATGAGKEFAIDTVVGFKIEEYFDYIVAGDEVKRAKPSPEIFLKAAEVLKLRPEQCIVIEDANLGLTAAKAAGMFAISIPDDLTRLQDHSMADAHLSTISELNDKLIKKLGG
jgi:beta-phosphoglucomutase